MWKKKQKRSDAQKYIDLELMAYYNFFSFFFFSRVFMIKSILQKAEFSKHLVFGNVGKYSKIWWLYLKLHEKVATLRKLHFCVSNNKIIYHSSASKLGYPVQVKNWPCILLSNTKRSYLNEQIWTQAANWLCDPKNQYQNRNFNGRIPFISENLSG